MIESITAHRDPQPQFEAMYVLMSTSQNVDRIIRDFSNGHQQYAAAHLFFIDGTYSLARQLRGRPGDVAPVPGSLYQEAASTVNWV